MMLDKKSAKGKIEKLSEKLYSRTKYRAPEDFREPIIKTEEEKVPENFETPSIDDLLMSGVQKKGTHPLIRKVFIVALLFFVCASIAATLIYFKGDNFISTKNLDISVEGPINISAGSIVELAITITNRNNAALDNINMSIAYPDGTRSAEDPTQELRDTEEALDEFNPGEKITKNERAIFLGSQGAIKQVRVSVDYRVKGSNAVFTKDKVFELTISSAPVTVTVIRPEMVNSGDSFDTKITIAANSQEILKNLVLRAEYPYGWNLLSSNPKVSDSEKRIWVLGDLSPGEKKTITLHGVLLGEDKEERTFRFFVGVGKGSSSAFDTVLASDSTSIVIERPTIDLNITLNSESSKEYIAPAGRSIQGVVTFKNNLTENLNNPQIEVKFSGSALDRSSISPVSGGFFNSSSNSIIWNKANTQGISSLAPGDAGSVTFNFASLQGLPTGAANQRMDISATLSGRPQNATADVKVSESRSVKIASEVALRAESLYSRGPFTNRGLVPPKAEEETTYTITLNAANTRNDIFDVLVTGTLGANVQWAEEIFPSDADFTYNEGTRSFTWDIYKLESGAGFSSPGKEVSFKVSLIPSLGQVGGVPVLVGNIALTGFDEFTNNSIRITHPAITTRISSDPRYVQGDEIVVK